MKSYPKLIFTVISGVVLAAALYMFVVRPALGRVNKLTEENRQTQAEIVRLDQQITAYKTARSDLAKAKDKGLLYSTILTDTTLFLPIEELEAAAAKTGSTHQLSILRDNLDEIKKGKKNEAARITSQTQLEEVPYVLSVQNTSYVDLLKFVQYLEKLPHFTEISKIEYFSQEDTTEISATISGVFLAKKNESTSENETTEPVQEEQ